ncbi:MAG: RNA polymerase sigma factor [Janthinobacterium lividum]
MRRALANSLKIFLVARPTFSLRPGTLGHRNYARLVADSPTPLSLEEQRLLVGCLAQDRQAQYRLYQQYKMALFSSALRILSDRALAQDALQEAFVDIFQGLAGFRQQSTLGAWMKAIVVRRALRTLQREPRQEVYDQDRHPEPAVAWHDSLTGEALDQAISELPASYRAVFCLIEVEGYTHQEVAELLAITEGTSKSQLYHAKRLLQRKLQYLYP